MPEKTKLEKASWTAGISAAVVAIAGLVIVYADHSSVYQNSAVSEPAKMVQIQQQAGDQSTQIGQISGGTVSINQYGEKSEVIPKVLDMTYDHARHALIQAGWMPAMRSWIEGNSVDVQSGNGPIFWKRGYRELDSCSGTGQAFCLFYFTDPKGNVLRVVTAGEEYEDGSVQARVCSTHLETEEEKEKKSREEQARNARESRRRSIPPPHADGSPNQKPPLMSPP